MVVVPRGVTLHTLVAPQCIHAREFLSTLLTVTKRAILQMNCLVPGQIVRSTERLATPLATGGIDNEFTQKLARRLAWTEHVMRCRRDTRIR